MAKTDEKLRCDVFLLFDQMFSNFKPQLLLKEFIFPYHVIVVDHLPCQVNITTLQWMNKGNIETIVNSSTPTTVFHLPSKLRTHTLHTNPLMSICIHRLRPTPSPNTYAMHTERRNQVKVRPARIAYKKTISIKCYATTKIIARIIKTIKSFEMCSIKYNHFQNKKLIRWLTWACWIRYFFSSSWSRLSVLFAYEETKKLWTEGSSLLSLFTQNLRYCMAAAFYKIKNHLLLVSWTV